MKVSYHEPIDLVKPLLHVVEALQVSSIVDNNNSVRAAIVTRSNSSEALLASSIPLKIIKSRYERIATKTSLTSNNLRFAI